MIPIISVVGSAKSGKTFFIEKLVNELRIRKYKIGAAKHTSHSFEVDKPGKDSYRLKECGSSIGGIFSNDKMMIVKDLEKGEDVARLAFEYFYDMDLVLIEGYREYKLPKILILASDKIKEEADGFNKDEIIAVIGTGKINTDLNYFGRYEIKRIADFIEENYIKAYKKEAAVDLFINGKRVVLKDYLKKLVGNVVIGIVKSLKGGEKDIENIEIKYKPPLPSKKA